MGDDFLKLGGIKKKAIALCAALCTFMSAVAIVNPHMTLAADKNDSEIIILYENDVHCSIDGYAKIAGLKDELSHENEYVGVVSSGDYIQGGTAGTVSKGEYIVNLMNIVGYDAAALGNHEFDYKIDRLLELTKIMNTSVVCSNFKLLKTNKTVFDPYVIVPYGETKVAYIGVTTPDTITSSSPMQFKNENDEYIYTFSGDNLYDVVQDSIDSALRSGADYVIALTHLGTENVYPQWSAQTLIENTSGLDIVLDGHSHSVVENMNVTDKAGDSVVVSSTGTGFKNIGKLTIGEDEIKTELIPTETVENSNSETAEYIEKINEECSSLAQQVVGKSEVRLNMDNGAGERLVRNTETNLGDFCADAYRYVTGADIGFINGGGMRANIEKGDVTLNDLLSVFPYNNKTCVVRTTGQAIADMLELSVMIYPEENGSFQHISGLTFDLDASIDSHVVLDSNQEFVSVDGDRRVSNIRILNSKTNEYEPINLSQEYTLASHTYLLREYGGGATMFKDATVLTDNGLLDIELLEKYITEYLGGTISKDYETSQDRINVIDEYIPLRKTFEAMGCEVIWTPYEPDKIIVCIGDKTVIFMADTQDVSVGDFTYELDRTTYIEDGTTYISADALSVIKN